MDIKKTLTFTTSLLMFFMLGSVLVYAQTDRGNDDPTDRIQHIGINIPNPLKGETNTIPQLFRAIIDNVVLPIGGVLAVLAFIYSGFLYVMAQGKPAEIERANRALLYTAIGTAVLLGAWVISSVIETTIENIKNG